MYFKTGNQILNDHLWFSKGWIFYDPRHSLIADPFEYILDGGHDAGIQSICHTPIQVATDGHKQADGGTDEQITGCTNMDGDNDP